MKYYDMIVTKVIEVSRARGIRTADFWDFYDEVFDDVYDGILSTSADEARTRLEGDLDFREYAKQHSPAALNYDWLMIEDDFIGQIELNAYIDAREVLGLED